jgi:hypothetical protein
VGRGGDLPLVGVVRFPVPSRSGDGEPGPDDHVGFVDYSSRILKELILTGKGGCIGFSHSLGFMRPLSRFG